MIDATASQVAVAFGLTLFAGLATGIGSAIAFFSKRTNYGMLSISLGFSAGVMLYVSFTEILSKAQDALSRSCTDKNAAWITAASFFGGIMLIGLIDRLVPMAENPHEARESDKLDQLKPSAHPLSSSKLHRLGLMAALAIGIHNFPEGMATFVAALDDPTVGLAIAIAIALHNIPEGVSVSVPIYYATGSRKKAFLLSLASGIAEPLGAILGYAILRNIMTPGVMGALFGLVAGIMVFISLDELLPTAREYGKGHQALYGLVGGMMVMAISLLLLS